MPEKLTIGIFVLGAILLLIGIVGGGFKLFGAEIPGGVSNRNRIIASILGCALIAGSLLGGAFLMPKQPPSPINQKSTDSVITKTTPLGPVAAEVYVSSTGSFEQKGELWMEYQPYTGGHDFSYKEAMRDDQYILIYDETRYPKNDPARVFHVRIPVSGGMSQWSYPNPFEWKDLYPVKPKTN